MTTQNRFTADTSGAAALRSIAIRRARKLLKADVKAGRVHVDVLLRQHPPAGIGGMKVVKLLAAVPGVGPARRARILRRAQVTETLRLDELGFGQRVSLIADLSDHRARRDARRAAS